MSVWMQAAIVAIVVAVVAFTVSYLGIFGKIPLSSQLQLLLQVIGVAIVVLGLSLTAVLKLNAAIDQADKP